MALETSRDAYEQLYDNTAPEEQDKYYEGYVEMKTGLLTWTKYWCVLKKKNLHFFKDVNTQIKEHYEGYFCLNGVTSVEAKPKNNEWHMIKGNKDSRKITLRTENPQLRDFWIGYCRKAIRGEPPDHQSHILPGSGAFRERMKRPSLQISPTSAHSPASPRYHPMRKISIDSVRSLPPDQLQRLVEHAQQIVENVTMTKDEIRIQEQLLATEKSWYQPTARREDAEELLKDFDYGVFIVRDYIDRQTSKKMGYVISLKNRDGQWRHHRINDRPDGKLVLKIEGHEEKPFNSLHNLLLFFITSQRKTITLTPYSPEIQSGDSYEVMDPPAPQSGSAQRRGQFPKARSQSVKTPRGTAAPVQPSVGRAESFKNRALPSLPINGSQDSTDGGGYENVDVPTRRPLPPPPGEDEGEYLEPSDQNAETFTMKMESNADYSSSDGYMQMQSPKKKLDRIQSGVELLGSPGSSDQSAYVDMHPPSCPPSYENVSPNGFIGDEPPKLPPRRAQSMKQDRSYLNLPPRGEEITTRAPLRKAFTLDH